MAGDGDIKVEDTDEKADLKSSRDRKSSRDDKDRKGSRDDDKERDRKRGGGEGAGDDKDKAGVIHNNHSNAERSATHPQAGCSYCRT
jgi:hypothetical protein